MDCSVKVSRPSLDSCEHGPISIRLDPAFAGAQPCICRSLILHLQVSLTRMKCRSDMDEVRLIIYFWEEMLSTCHWRREHIGTQAAQPRTAPCPPANLSPSALQAASGGGHGLSDSESRFLPPGPSQSAMQLALSTSS